MKPMIALAAAAALLAAPAFAQQSGTSPGAMSSTQGQTGTSAASAHKAHHKASKPGVSGGNETGGPTSDQSATPGNTSPQ